MDPEDTRPWGQPEGGRPAESPEDEQDRAGGEPDIFPIDHAAGDAPDVVELAEAERAVARHGATPEQRAGIAEVGQVRRAEERLERWRGRHV